MQIFGPYRVNTTQQPTGPRPNQAADTQTSRISKQPVDQLDLSSEVQGTNRLSSSEAAPTVEGIRFEKVAEIRRQIAEGSYDTDEKLDAAMDRLLDEIG